MKIYRNPTLKMFALFIGVLVFISTSCYQDVIDIDLSEIDKQIVIEGVITDRSYSCKVMLSETSSIYRPGNERKISRAIVTITDDQGNIGTLNETEPGIYQNNSLIGVPGRTYTMEVLVEKNMYTAVSQMPVPLELDSVVYNLIYPPVYRLSCYFTDHEGIRDYCRLRIYRNQQYLKNEKILYHDNYTDGKIVVVDNIDEIFYLNDRVNIELLTIDKNIYDFYSVLFSQEDANSPDESIIDLASANIKSNISNNALGYFSAQTIRSYSTVIK